MQVAKVDVIKRIRGRNVTLALSWFEEHTLILLGYLSTNRRALLIGCGDEFKVCH